MTDATIAPAIPAEVATAVNEASAILAQPEVQALEAPLAAKIPAKVRATIYEIAKWVGLVGAGATATAALLDGQASLYVGSGGFILVALTNLLAKAHVTAA